MVLFIATVVQVTFSIAPVASSFKQLLIRTFYLLNFIYMVYIFSKEDSRQIDKVCKIIIVVTSIYSIYEILIIFFHLPTPRNIFVSNPSFVSDNPSRGEIFGGVDKLFRLSLFWFEPSFAALSLGFLFLYSLLFNYPKKYLALILMSGILTFSRSLILPISLMLLIHFVDIYLSKRNIKYRLCTAIIILIILIVALHVYFINKDITGNILDFSFISRNNSIIIGYKIFLDHFIIGTGFNTFAFYSGRYSTHLLSYMDTAASLSIISNYLYSMGLLGFLFLFGIIMSIVRYNCRQIYKIQLLSFILSFGVFSVDVFYLPVTYLFMALVIVRGNS